jgi:hypothetical protein
MMLLSYYQGTKENWDIGFLMSQSTKDRSTHPDCIWIPILNKAVASVQRPEKINQKIFQSFCSDIVQ